MNCLKNLFSVVTALVLSLLFMNCNTTKQNQKMHSVDFDATCLGEYKYAGPDTLPNPRCTDTLTAWRAIVDCNGEGTPVGKFTVHFDFCGDTAGHYGNAIAVLVAENGDSLFMDVSGQVIEGRLEEHPDYVISWWRDEFTITGGTGVYEGATGVLASDDYNSSEDPYSHHRWTGKLSMRE